MTPSNLAANWPAHRGTIALWLRLGLGAVFVIGGWSKLSQLLDPAQASAIVEQYVGPAGYINAFFLDYLFTGLPGSLFTPWGFLTLLSSFELLSGLLLLAGLLVRPLALIYAFLLWSFVFSLPVVTTPGVETELETYTSPALFVQVRDIALSGMMFVLFNLGAGRFSVDAALGRSLPPAPGTDPEAIGLLLRLSLAAPLLVGGFFAGMANIQSFALYAPLLIIAGMSLVAGVGLRLLAAVSFAGMSWYMLGKISADNSLIANLNGFKREFALATGYAVLGWFGGGSRFVWWRPATAAGEHIERRARQPVT